VRGALANSSLRAGFRLVHFSVQRDHLHLIAEASERIALARGVQALAIRVARAVNSCLGRKGKVFADRYHARALSTPRAVRFAVRYVLLNANKHERGAHRVRPGHVDGCSSAPWFEGFARPIHRISGAAGARRDWQQASGSSEPPVVAPRSWLLSVGLSRAGPFDVDEMPSAKLKHPAARRPSARAGQNRD
jgi:hypothetical protein